MQLSYIHEWSFWEHWCLILARPCTVSRSASFNPVAGALIPDIVAETQLQQANSYFLMKNALESIAGIILAGVLYAALPIPLASVLAGGILKAFGSTVLLSFCSLGFAVTAVSLLFNRRIREL